MSDVLERRRQANRHDVTLPSGLAVTIRLPRLIDCILAGDVPATVLSSMDGGTEQQEASLEQMRANKAFNDRLVCEAVVAIEGEDVKLTPADLADVFTAEEDITEVVAYASRAKDFSGEA